MNTLRSITQQSTLLYDKYHAQDTIYIYILEIFVNRKRKLHVLITVYKKYKTNKTNQSFKKKLHQ